MTWWLACRTVMRPHFSQLDLRWIAHKLRRLTFLVLVSLQPASCPVAVPVVLLVLTWWAGVCFCGVCAVGWCGCWWLVSEAAGTTYCFCFARRCDRGVLEQVVVLRVCVGSLSCFSVFAS